MRRARNRRRKPKRCAYISSAQMMGVLQTSVHAKTIRELDEKADKSLQKILERTASVNREVQEVQRHMEEVRKEAGARSLGAAAE